VSNSNIAGKTEVSLEFANLGSGAKNKGDELVEIRFYVPGSHSKLKTSVSDAGSQNSDQEDDDEEISAAQVFHEQVKEKAGEQITGDIILACEEVQVLTPRGRYDVDIYLEFLRLRGKTYDYKVLYSSISKLFLLPKDDMHVVFIVCTACSFSIISNPCLLAILEHPHPPRTDKISILGHAIYTGGRNNR
jgi:structure-specific recognition protein 1